MTLFLFGIQFVTGMILSFYYVPYFEQAHKSIIEIVTKLNMGWFFRSLHHWGAQCAIFTLFVHLFGTLLLKSYRKPRELLWFSGFILLGIAIFFGLSGYLLLWDERAFAAVRVATGGLGALPFVGPFGQAFLRGGIDVTGETLTRFYAFHVTVLPFLSLALVGLHLLLVQYHGMSVPLSQKGKKARETPFFPNVLYKDLIVWLILLGIVVTLATLLPPEIGNKADPLAPPPENVKPEWYFLFLFQTLKLFPGDILGLNGEVIAILLIMAAVLFFFLIPFFDRKSNAGQRSPFFTGIAVIYLLYFLIMTAIGYFS
jgi:cytochrome b6